MKKQIICGAIAILLTGLSATVFSTAAPGLRERDNAPTATSTVSKETIDRGRYACPPAEAARMS